MLDFFRSRWKARPPQNAEGKLFADNSRNLAAERELPAFKTAFVDTTVVQSAMGQFREKRPGFPNTENVIKEIEALLFSCFSDEAIQNVVTSLLADLIKGEDIRWYLSNLCPKDQLFVQNIIELHSSGLFGEAKHFQPKKTFSIGIAQDVLTEGLNNWSVYRLLNLALLACIQPRRKVAIVTSIRNEGAGILEWISHHRSIGLTDFYVYTNDNTDESDELLEVLAANGIIRLIHNQVAPGAKVQTKILEHAVHLLSELREYEWVFFIDVDEFFLSRSEPGLTFESFLYDFETAFPTNRPAAICFNWKWFGSENSYAATGGFLLERFVHSIHNEHVKTIVTLPDVVSMTRVHVPVLVDGAELVNSAFIKVNPSIHMTPVYGKGQINHYWNKSFQEFALKRSRGRISAGFGGVSLEFSSFFEWGANGIRGNFDAPQDRVLIRMKTEHALLLSLPNTTQAHQKVLLRFNEMIEELENNFNLKEIYQGKGKPIDDRN